MPGFRHETQVICTVLSHDLENDSDIPALIGVSAALTLSGIPFMGPIGGARVGYIDGAYIINPTLEQIAESKLDLVVAGTAEGVLMVESEASELSEEVMLGAVTFGQKEFGPVIDLIIDLAELCAKEPWNLPAASDEYETLKPKILSLIGGDIDAAYKERVKQNRQEKLSSAKKKMGRGADRRD